MVDMRAMFRLTGKPVADICLIFLWWPIAASIFVLIALVQLISTANRRVDESDRRAADGQSRLSTETEESARTRAAREYTRRLPPTDPDRRTAVDLVTQRLSTEGVITKDKLDQLADLTLAIGAAKTRGELVDIVGAPLEMFGPIKGPPEPTLVRLNRLGPLIATALGVSLMVLGGVVNEFGVAFLGCVLIVGAVAVWTWRQARGSRVWKTVGLAFLAWMVTVTVAAVLAPPQTTPAGPKATSWPEWCAMYSNADGSLQVGPPDIRPAVLAAETLPVPTDPTAARDVGYAVTLVGSKTFSSTYGNSYYQRSAAEHMTNAATVICVQLLAHSLLRSGAAVAGSVAATPPSSAQLKPGTQTPVPAPPKAVPPAVPTATQTLKRSGHFR